MQYIVHMPGRKRPIHRLHQPVYSRRQKILQKGADHIKGQIKNKPHDTDEGRDRRIFPCQDAVDFPASRMFPALPRFYHRFRHQILNKSKAHIGDGRRPIKPSLLFHLPDDML